MVKTDLINKVSEITGITKKDTKDTIDAMLDVIVESINNDEKIVLNKFGVFEPRITAARYARNMQTGEPMTTTPRRVIRFRMSNCVKDSLEV